MAHNIKENSDSNNYNRNKLEKIPIFEIFQFYSNSILIGFWHIIKLFISFLWKSIKQKRTNSGNENNSKLNYYNSYSSLSDNDLHDKPPSCLIDSSYGQHSYVKLKHVKLHYIEVGNKNDPLIVLLHGYPDCWLGWRKQISDLSKFFHVVVLDLKGFNDSDKPQWRNKYKPENICSELQKFIKALGCSSATIIGHDLGALIGWLFAHLFPDSIDRFICVSTSHPNLFWDNLSNSSSVTFFNNNFIKFTQLPFLPEMELSSFSNENESYHLNQMFKHLNKKKDENIVKVPVKNGKSNKNGCDSEGVMDAYKYVFSRKSDWTGPLSYFRNFPFYRIKEGEIIRCPVLIVAGNADQTCRLETVVKSSDFCDNFIVKIIDSASHWPHQECPEEFNSILMKFLVGRRATLTNTPPTERSSSKGIFSRVLGVANNSVGKIGGYVMDTVQHRTNEALLGSIS